ncbi:adenylate cyclase [Fontimonas thermophila]|uniref:Adenylate cyclase n=1 Tax=Fontimonas thermophila TaxID=1076937 RepID=A0A1I2K4W0_9GAMM|nr:CYTH domain-containing protein [Fontimonas thermophila]SFF61944.1 adenylate cyclase [Fontimonas thermophila]
MALEIERKFLVVGQGWRAQVRRSVEIRQGYLGGEGGRASVRVRLQGNAASLNIKAAVVGRARTEYEYDIPYADGREMLDTLCVGRIDKIRHYVECDGLTWEIDEFGGDNAGLVVAEVELASLDQVFVRPPWLGREVTEDQRYYNQYLALHPYRSWPDAD